MWSYYFFVVYLFFAISLVSPKLKDQNVKKYMFLIIPLFLYAACRGNGIGDYFNYLNRGQYVNNITDIFFTDIGMEIGYKVLALFIKILHLPRQSIIIFMNTISFLCLNSYIKKYSSHWSLSLLVFLPVFFQFEMHAARTGVAIAIISLGYKYIERKQFISYLVTVFLASLFHTTALIALILFVFGNKEIKLKIGIPIIILEYFFVGIMGIDNIVIFFLSKLHMNNFLIKYIAYSNSQEYGYSLQLWDPRIFIGIIVYIIACLFIKNKTSFEHIAINSIFLYTSFLILLSSHTFIAYRISSFFYYPMISLIPSIIAKGEFSKQTKNINIIMLYGIVIAFSILGCVYASQNPEYIPFWDNGKGLLPWN